MLEIRKWLEAVDGDIHEIVIEGCVGSMEVVLAEGSELIVALAIEAKRNWSSEY